MSYSSAMFFAIGAAMTMATVLLAVATSIRPVSSATPSMPPRLPRKLRRMKPRIASNPPFSRISAAVDATRIVTIMVSNMPVVPLPIAEKADM